MCVKKLAREMTILVCHISCCTACGRYTQAFMLPEMRLLKPDNLNDVHTEAFV